MRSCPELLRRAFDAANKNGDLTCATYCWPHLIMYHFLAGDALSEVQREAEHGLAFAQKAQFGIMIDVITAQLVLIQTLRGLTPRLGCFNGGQIEEIRFEHHLSRNPALALAECWYWIRKLQARYMAGDYPAAMESSAKAQGLLWTLFGFLDEVDYHFYTALSRAASCDSVSTNQRQQHLEALSLHQRQLDIWAENCPENFENRAALVGAEIARIEGREIDAQQLYERAIRSAHANGFVQNEAVANEVAARFYAARGFEKIAHAYLRDARYCYQRWGADGKVRQLDELFPQLSEEKQAASGASTIETPVERLDLRTVIKVSQAVSAEMDLDKLVDTLMRAAIEHAGAARGLLILLREDGQQVEAEATTMGDTILVQRKEAALGALAQSIINYVVRTQEFVILDDASSQNRFAADTYISEHHARSVLCLPLIKQGKLVGVLYLENNLAPRVFTPSRIALLKVVASQAAISLESSRLYSELREREAKIRRLVDANIIGICIWNVEGDIINANEAFLKMVGYDREPSRSAPMRWTEMTPSEWRENDARVLAELHAKGTAPPFEKELFRKDGSRVPILVGAALFEAGETEGVAFVLDLSEQKRAEAEIRGLKDQLYRENLALRAANREISELKDKLVQEKLYLEQEIRGDMHFEQIVGNSPALKRVLELVETVAPNDSTVLLLGETGTGKELIARAVHDRSRRKDRTFVKLNCAAIPTGLLESELFGHEKGAFTGAVAQKIGRLELADQGTLFLDEVGDIPIEIQPKLLRALQEREFERLGSTHTRKVNVRLVAATNRDLEKMIKEREFRSDLYYRLNVFPIRIPPLRERKDDIPLLVSYFVERFAKQMQKKIDSIPAAVMKSLTAWGWPGNIRELENLIERSVILTRGRLLEAPLAELQKTNTEEPPPADLHEARPVAGERTNSRRDKTSLTDEYARKQRDAIVRALTESKGRVGGPHGAAARLGTNRTTLLARMKKFGIDRREYA